MSDLTITLTGQEAEKLERLMRERAYSSPEQAVSDALSALEAETPHDALDAWLDEVAQRYDASLVDPDEGLTPAQLRARLSAAT